jgi:hypothetical protein
VGQGLSCGGDRFQSANNPQELYVTDQNVPYLAAIVIVMFLVGCVLIVVSLGDRLRERVRWFSPMGRKH